MCTAWDKYISSLISHKAKATGIYSQTTSTSHSTCLSYKTATIIIHQCVRTFARVALTLKRYLDARIHRDY